MVLPRSRRCGNQKPKKGPLKEKRPGPAAQATRWLRRCSIITGNDGGPRLKGLRCSKNSRGMGTEPVVSANRAECERNGPIGHITEVNRPKKRLGKGLITHTDTTRLSQTEPGEAEQRGPGTTRQYKPQLRLSHNSSPRRENILDDGKHPAVSRPPKPGNSKFAARGVRDRKPMCVLVKKLRIQGQP